MSVNSLTIDNFQNIYITGSLYGKFYFNNQSISAYRSDIFLLKLTKDFRVDWVKLVGAYRNDRGESGYSIALDNTNQYFYVTGCFAGLSDFGDGILVNPEDENIFLAKYSIDGRLKWVIKEGNWSGAASQTEKGRKVIVDKNGFIYLAGEFSFDGFFGDTVVTAYYHPAISNRNNDIFLAKYYANGELSWLTHAGSYGDDEIEGLAKDSQNNVIILGSSLSGIPKFDDYLLTPADNYISGYVGKFQDISEPNRYDETVSTIDGKKSPTVSIYPNPTKDKLNINMASDKNEIILVKIQDLMGKLVYRDQFNSNRNYTINIGHLESGIYIISLDNNMIMQAFKIIKR